MNCRKVRSRAVVRRSSPITRNRRSFPRRIRPLELQPTNLPNRDNRRKRSTSFRSRLEREGAPKIGLLRLCTRERSEIERPRRIDRSSWADLSRPARSVRNYQIIVVTFGPRRRFLVERFSRAHALAPTHDATWEFSARLLGQRAEKQGGGGGGRKRRAQRN